MYIVLKYVQQVTKVKQDWVDFSTKFQQIVFSPKQMFGHITVSMKQLRCRGVSHLLQYSDKVSDRVGTRIQFLRLVNMCFLIFFLQPIQRQRINIPLYILCLGPKFRSRLIHKLTFLNYRVRCSWFLSGQQSTRLRWVVRQNTD